jgi:hypothetical protein
LDGLFGTTSTTENINVMVWTKQRGSKHISLYVVASSDVTAVKVEVAPQHAMDGTEGSRGIGLLIVNCGVKWEWVINVTPRPLYPRTRTRVLILQEAASLHCRSGGVWGR